MGYFRYYLLSIIYNLLLLPSSFFSDLGQSVALRIPLPSLGHSAYPIEFPTLALTDIRGEPREAVEEFGGQGCEGTGPQEAGRYRLAEDV